MEKFFWIRDYLVCIYTTRRFPFIQLNVYTLEEILEVQSKILEEYEEEEESLSLDDQLVEIIDEIMGKEDENLNDDDLSVDDALSADEDRDFLYYLSLYNMSLLGDDEIEYFLLLFRVDEEISKKMGEDAVNLGELPLDEKIEMIKDEIEAIREKVNLDDLDDLDDDSDDDEDAIPIGEKEWELWSRSMAKYQKLVPIGDKILFINLTKRFPFIQISLNTIFELLMAFNIASPKERKKIFAEEEARTELEQKQKQQARVGSIIWWQLRSLGFFEIFALFYTTFPFIELYIGSREKVREVVVSHISDVMGVLRSIDETATEISENAEDPWTI